MKRQLVYTVFILVLLGLSSCTTYYFSLVDSEDKKIVKLDNGDFMQENDTLSVSYCFYGEDLPIEITIYNKLDQPLFLDWQQSALIMDETANSYIAKEVPVSGVTSSSTYNYKDYLFPDMESGFSKGSFSGRASLPEYIAFIPPHTMTNSTPITISNFEFELIPKNQYTKRQFHKKNNEMITVKAIDFSEYDSPLRFKSYLTFFTVDESGVRNKSFILQHDFYLSQLIRAGTLHPSNMLAFKEQRGDFFYVRKESKNVTLGVIVGVAAIGVAGVAVDAAISPRRY